MPAANGAAMRRPVRAAPLMLVLVLVLAVVARAMPSSFSRFNKAARSEVLAAMPDATFTVSVVTSNHFAAANDGQRGGGGSKFATAGAAGDAIAPLAAPAYGDGLSWADIAAAFDAANTTASSASKLSTAGAAVSPQAAFNARLARDTWGQWSAAALAAEAPALPWAHPEVGLLTVALPAAPGASSTEAVEVFYSRNTALFAAGYTEEHQVFLGGKRVRAQEPPARALKDSVGAQGHCYYTGKVIGRHTVAAGNAGSGGLSVAAAVTPTMRTLAEAAAAPAVEGSYVAFDACAGGFTGLIAVPAAGNGDGAHAGGVFGIRPALNNLPQREVAAVLASAAAANTAAGAGVDAGAASPGALHVVYAVKDHARAALRAANGIKSSKGSKTSKSGAKNTNTNAEDEDDGADIKTCGVDHDHEHDDDHQHQHQQHAVAGFGGAYADDELAALAARVRKEVAAAKRASTSTSTSTGMQTQALPSRIYVELLLASDYKRYTAYGAATEQDSAALANLMAAMYTATDFSTPVSVVLVAQVAFVTGDPWNVAVGTCSQCGSSEVSVDELLARWHIYRSGAGNVPAHDNGQLLSGHDFQATVLGYAGVAVQCNKANAGGIDQTTPNYSTEYLATIVAHELGHNFGMQHDSQGNACPQSGYIMNAVVGAKAPTQFSSCSLTYYTNTLTDAQTCLFNEPTTKWGDVSVCGNGFVEEGEVCDCGKADCSGVDPCCDGATCQLVAGAQCSRVDGCCDDQCKIVSASMRKICRAAAPGGCDLPEYCSGSSSSCPADLVLGPGHSCRVNGANGACFAGACMAHEASCRAAGASFPGAPYTSCSDQRGLNNGNVCGTMYCASSTSSGSCTYFSSGGSPRQMDNGVACGAGQLCFNSECVGANTLATSFAWVGEEWGPCSECGTPQRREVLCVDTATNTPVGADMSQLCPPVLAMPDLERPCQNKTLGCVYAEQLGSDTRIFTVRVPKTMLAYVIIGFVVVFVLGVALCYRAVTKPVNGVKNMADRAAMAKRSEAFLAARGLATSKSD